MNDRAAQQALDEADALEAQLQKLLALDEKLDALKADFLALAIDDADAAEQIECLVEDIGADREERFCYAVSMLKSAVQERRDAAEGHYEDVERGMANFRAVGQ